MSFLQTFLVLQRMHPAEYAPVIDCDPSDGSVTVEGVGVDFRIDADGSYHGPDEFWNNFTQFDPLPRTPLETARNLLTSYTGTPADFDLPESVHYLETDFYGDRMVFTTYTDSLGATIPLFWPDSGEPWTVESARDRLWAATPQITGVPLDLLGIIG